MYFGKTSEAQAKHWQYHLLMVAAWGYRPGQQPGTCGCCKTFEHGLQSSFRTGAALSTGSSWEPRRLQIRYRECWWGAAPSLLFGRRSNWKDRHPESQNWGG